MTEEIDYEIKIIIDGKEFGQSILHDLTIASIGEDIAEHFEEHKESGEE
jgi:hypothetical protein